MTDATNSSDAGGGAHSPALFHLAALRSIRARARVFGLMRAGTVAAMAAGFVWLAIEFDPVQSSAQFEAVQNAQRGPEEPLRGKLLGSLIGPIYTIRIHCSPEGPLYSVWDTKNGRSLAEGLPADDVYRHFPDIDVRTMRLGPGDAPDEVAEFIGPLMQVDENHGEFP